MEQEWIFCVFPDGHTELLRRDEIPETEWIIKYCYDKNENEKDMSKKQEKYVNLKPYDMWTDEDYEAAIPEETRRLFDRAANSVEIQELMNKKNEKYMTQEEKELLIKDLSGRIPYRHNVWLLVREFDEDAPSNRRMLAKYIDDIYTGWVVECKPYLRPISSMTEEEYNELKKISSYYGLAPFEDIHNWAPNYNLIDWLNRKMFDYRDLIPKGLALEAIKGMYNN